MVFNSCRPVRTITGQEDWASRPKLCTLNVLYKVRLLEDD